VLCGQIWPGWVSSEGTDWKVVIEGLSCEQRRAERDSRRGGDAADYARRRLGWYAVVFPEDHAITVIHVALRERFLFIIHSR